MTDTVRVPISRQEARLAAQSGVVAWLSGYKQEYRAPHDTLCDLIADAMLAASPQGEGSSADPAPIKPSGDTGELREKLKRAIWTQLPQEDANMGTSGRIADAILDLIQSERAGPRVSILSTKFVGDNANGQPIFEGGADGVTNITLHGWTCFGPDEAGQKALAGFQSERAG